MALNIDAIIADAFLSLCDAVPLKSVTVKMILDRTGISRQTFYNHFLDKQDLIQFIYDTRVACSDELNQHGSLSGFYEYNLAYYNRIRQHHRFMKQACLMSGQNCLTDYMISKATNFSTEWLCNLTGGIDEELRLAVHYQVTASINMVIGWILSDMPIPDEALAKLITSQRELGLNPLIDKARGKQ